MKLEIRKADETRKGTRADAFVVFAEKSRKDAPSSFETVPEELREAARQSAPPEAGADGTLYTAPLGAGSPAARLYVCGVGVASELTPRKARGLLRSALRTLEKNGERSARIDFPFTLPRMNAGEAREFLARTALTSGYSFTRYKSKDAGKARLASLAFSAARGPWAEAADKSVRAELAEAHVVATAAALVRDLGNTPPCDLTPRVFADEVGRQARKRGLKVRILRKKEIETQKMGGILAVAQGSVEEPRLVVLEHHGGKKGEAPIVLVGKGVTFDSGGISIKPADRMGDMKWDMLGAATVAGILLAAAELGLPLNLVGLTPLAENLPSGSAYKPGDIVRFRNGKTAEIDNTDAEGRVLLADALDYAREWKPRAILDYATLTGAAVVALGLEATVLFANDDALAKELISAGERTDERLWRLPLWDDYKENIRSDWADFKNTGGRYGGSINGAMFLKEFVDAGTPWAHLDIAPTAYFEKEFAGYPTGATAIGLALTLRWLRDRLSEPSR